MIGRPGRVDLALAVLAVVGAALFFPSVDRLWPRVQTPAVVDRDALEAEARAYLDERGVDVSAHETASTFALQDRATDYVDETFGRGALRSWEEEGVPFASHTVGFKRAGDPDTVWAFLDGAGRKFGWARGIQDDEEGPRLDVDEARLLARAALASGLDLAPDAWPEIGATATDLPSRRDHAFLFERVLSDEPELRERASVDIAGDLVVGASRFLHVPARAAREARARQAPARALLAVGVLCLAGGGIAGFWIFLTRLRDGRVRLGRVAVLIGILWLSQTLVSLLDPNTWFWRWDTLWPRWLSTLEALVYGPQRSAWMLVVLFAVVAAADALDRERGTARMRSLWALMRGHIADPAVSAASVRGFLLGLVCGGTLAAGVLALVGLGVGTTELQPRGFFLYSVNSAAPTASTLLFFLAVALIEELGYRAFGGVWLEWRTGRRWLAIALPAVIYGMTHTMLDFLPPAEPFWGRAVVMALVGAVWGWGFFRFDALTVVLSHWTADLFIFNLPRLASGDPWTTMAAVATIAVPLVPAIAAALARRRAVA